MSPSSTRAAPGSHRENRFAKPAAFVFPSTERGRWPAEQVWIAERNDAAQRLFNRLGLRRR